jgi:hypothetical protein
MAKLEPGSQPDRAPVGGFKASRSWEEVQQQGRAVPSATRRVEPNPCGHP